ncbi:MAG: hypothetical protein HC905_00010 [Bacteroidales bacterium]|nr:hypothetical protein [Bacteroidales bacterium]
MRGIGIEAYPVLISTRGNGSIYKDYPFLHFFNYVVVLVNIDGKNFITDATEMLCPFDRIPSRCLNFNGLIIKKDGQDWVNLINPEVSRINKDMLISFNEEKDSLNFIMRNRFSLYEAFDYKSTFKNDLKEISRSLGNKGYQNIDSLNTSNYDESKNPYLLQFRASIPVESAGNKIYISPFLNEPPSENPLKQVTRTYPVDFTYPFGRNFSSTIEIPQGYKVEFTPEPFKINNQMVSVDYQVFRSEVNKSM